MQLQGPSSNFQGTSDDAGRLSSIHRSKLASSLRQMQADMHFDVCNRSKARNRILYTNTYRQLVLFGYFVFRFQQTL